VRAAQRNPTDTIEERTMAGTGAISGTSGGSTSQKTEQALRDVNMDDFLKLMIAELQNQDPLNPMDNAQMLQQISQIREIGATDKLSETLGAVQLGQSLSTASVLIGKQIKGLDDKNQQIEGVVDRVSIKDSKPTLHVGEKTVSLSNVSDIVPAASS
jgi:flagellar basal-body rod modification protein FlgD